MTHRTLAECYVLLSMMNAGREQKWDDGHKPLYELALKPLTDAEGVGAVKWAALNEEWRPSPARLIQIAAEQSSVIPDAEQSYAEIIGKAQSEGLFAMPHPERPSIKLEGPPPFSHPIVEKITHFCGGWRAICEGEANFSEGLKKQVRSAHESVSRQWREEVKQQLLLPPSQRNPRYFPAYVPPSLVEATEPLWAIEPRHVETPTLAELAPKVRELIAEKLTPKALK